MQRANGSVVWWMCSLGSLSDHPEQAGTLQEEESQRLLGRLGKSELLQVAFAKESEVKSRNRSVDLVTQQGEVDGVCMLSQDK